jgi:hypothetical protein
MVTVRFSWIKFCIFAKPQVFLVCDGIVDAAKVNLFSTNVFNSMENKQQLLKFYAEDQRLIENILKRSKI